MRKIAVVGSFVMDLIAQVDEFPQEGQTVIGKGFVTLPGGKGANQAVSASRQGADVAMYGRVGDDDFGKTFLGLFESEGIDTGRVKMLKEFPTAMGLIQLNRSGENKIVVVPGANFGYELDDLIRDSEDFLKADLVLAQLELKPEVTFKLIELCFDAKVPIILNPAPATAIPDDILSKITILTPNETELEILSGLPVNSLESAKRASEALLEKGVKCVVATLGKAGALIADKDGFKAVSGFKVEAVDTVAAGDAFNGALAEGIAAGKAMEEAVRRANAVGALAVTQRGAIPSIPKRETVDAFIDASQRVDGFSI